jgi:hypothetical protein
MALRTLRLAGGTICDTAGVIRFIDGAAFSRRHADMHGTQDMTFDSERTDAATPRTTAAGLEAWLSGVHADATTTPQHEAEALPESVSEPVVIEEIVEEVGPVNAAEALALGTITHASKLVGPDGAELIVDPERGGYYFESTSLRPLAAILQQPAEKWTPVYSEGMKAVRAANTPQMLERLFWFAGLVATPGILGRRLDRGARYKLARWPETEREFPKHFRIAKAMLKDPATIEDITLASGTTRDEVVDYVNASDAAGRLELGGANASAAAASQPEPPPATGGARGSALLAKLRRPLSVR